MAYDTALPRSTFLAQQAALRHRQPDRLLGVLRAVVHGGRDADAPRVRRAPAALARVVAPIVRRRRRRGARRVGADPRAHGRRLPARPGLPRLRRDAVLRRDEVLRLVVALRRRCCIRTCSRPTRRGSRRSPTRFQAGFWEEALFRAVPLAGAALIGDRFGQRRLFLVIGFVVQAADIRRRPCAVSRPSRRTHGRWS